MSPSTVVVRRSSFVVRRSSFVVRRSSFVVRRSSFVVRRSSFVVRFALIVIALAVPSQPQAQSTYPTKPVRLITAIPIGGDVYVRTFGAKLSDLLGQPFVVENRISAASLIALQSVATAPPDGHTLLIQSVTALISKNGNPKLAYDPVGDFVAIAKIYGGGGSALVVRTDFAAKSIEELVGLAKASPGKLSYGSTGNGSAAHLAAGVFLSTTSTQALHVPFKGANEIFQAMLRGDIDFAINATTNTMAQIRAGKLRALGVTSAARLRDLPDVPTLRDRLKNDLLLQENWAGLAAPLKTPEEIVRRLNAETVKALTDPGLRKVIEAAGNEPAAAESPEQYAAFVRRENEKWREIVKVAGIKLE